MFASRAAAGRALAQSLEADSERTLHVFAVSRDGIAIAVHVAAPFGAEVDVVCARYNAVAVAIEGCRPFVELDRVIELGLHASDVSADLALLQSELARVVSVFRGQRPFPSVHDRHVVVVDDGLAPSRLIVAAAQRMRVLGAGRVTVALPVSSRTALRALAHACDDIVCLTEGNRRGSAYPDTDTIGDIEALTLLDRSRLAASLVRSSARTITL